MSDGGAVRDALPLRALERVLQSVEAHAPGVALRPAFIRLCLRAVARGALGAAGLPCPSQARLFARAAIDDSLESDAVLDATLENVSSALLAGFDGASDTIPELLGGVFEALLALEIGGDPSERRLGFTRRRRQTGSFFTPSALSREVVQRAFAALEAGRLHAGELSICDPACGAGAFLIAAARSLLAARRERALEAAEPFDERAERRRIADGLAGVDIDPLAVAVSELALWSFVRDPELAPACVGQLFTGDALIGDAFGELESLRGEPQAFDWRAAFPGRSSFDLVIGNPPWIAYAGRATQPLAPERRAWLARRYAAFRGYPTLHAVFVERAAELAPRGVIALVVPSPIADLDGYRPLRRVLSATHVACEPLLEFGQDAFVEVTQPCFALIARPRDPALPPPDEPARPLLLDERARHGAPARAVSIPSALARLRSELKLPGELFREMGFQSTRAVTAALLARMDSPSAEHSYPLLEGRDISEFRVRAPRLYLRPDRSLLARERCRLRAPEDYREVLLVVRQTAKAPIAALHSGVPFRNSLLAGFETEGLPAPFLVGLLNSALYRAYHLSTQRDARQAIFPQVKIAHLRALPRPPAGREREKARVAEIVRAVGPAGITPESKQELDALVFALFGFANSDRQETLAFLRERAPELAR
jgi:hypothetical protein